MSQRLRIFEGSGEVANETFLTEREVTQLIEARLREENFRMEERFETLRAEVKPQLRRFWIANILLMSSTLILPLWASAIVLAAGILWVMPKRFPKTEILRENLTIAYCIE